MSSMHMFATTFAMDSSLMLLKNIIDIFLREFRFVERFPKFRGEKQKIAN